MPWTIKNITEETYENMPDDTWKDAGIQMHSLNGGNEESSHSLALLALEPEKCGLLQITFPLDEDGVMDAFMELRDTLKLDDVLIFTTNQMTEDDTHRLVKLAKTHEEEIPDSVLKEYMLQ